MSPSAIVFVPQGLDLAAPIELHVFFHGFDSCAAAVLSAGTLTCSDGGMVRPGLDLGAQLVDAGGNAVLLSAETLVDAPSGNPGRFAEDAGFRAFLDEALRDMKPTLGTVTVSRLSLGTLRGGYLAIAAVLQQSDVKVDDVYLLDGLFGSVPVFDEWIAADPAAHRFASIYTAAGGTALNNESMAAQVAALDAGSLFVDRTPGTVSDEQLRARHIFKVSGDPLPGDWMGRLWRSAR